MKRKKRKYGQDYYPLIDQIFMTLTSICAGTVLDTGIRMVLFSTGLSLEIGNLKANDVLVPINNFPSSQILIRVYSPTYICAVTNTCKVNFHTHP